MNSSSSYVLIGAIYEDRDPREKGRYATVVAIRDGYASCLASGKKGKRLVRIRVDRFKKAWMRCGMDANVPGAGNDHS